MDSLLVETQFQETHGTSMDALRLRKLTLLLLLLTACQANAATYQTVNFSVTAARSDVAEQVGKAAEVYRRQLAVFWIGKPLPNWSRPCRVTVSEGALGAGGQTTFQFVRGEVLNWRMEVQGTLERILDSVLPHEINHTIFACHFRRPLPRWADEGAATLFEHRSEQLKQLALLNEVIRNRDEMISLQDLLSMKEYPKGQRPMLTLYAQGYALADFLVQQKGRHAYLKFIADGEGGGWEEAIRMNFDHDGIKSLEKNWRGWVLAGMPKLTLPREQMLAANGDDAESKAQAASRPEIKTVAVPAASAKRRRTPSPVIRSQSPDAEASEENLADKPGQAAATAQTPSGGQRAVAAESGPTGLRRATIEAPTPKKLSAVERAADSASAAEKSGDRQNSAESFLDSALSPSAGTDDTPQQTSSQFDPHGLEPTALTTPASLGSNDSRNGNSQSFQFSGVDLPRERTVKSGSTPQWAGFPGQKKSF